MSRYIERNQELVVKFLDVARRDGLAYALSRIARRVRWVAQWKIDTRRVSIEFDRGRNVDTGGVLDLWRFDIKSPNVQYGTPYSGIHPETFHRAMRSLKVDFREYSFVDLGCGKGRALILAGEYKFRTVIGVEFAPELARIASENVRPMQQAKVLQMDAADFVFPREATILYLGNPFGPPVLSKVAERFTSDCSQEPPSYVIYAVPVHAKVLESRPELLPIVSDPAFRIWRLNANQYARESIGNSSIAIDGS